MRAEPAMVAPADLMLTVTDVKQWAYCKRVPYYRYVLPVGHVRTHRMERGKATERALAALERRRRLREYGLDSGERQFGVSLRSERLGLSGKLDLLIVTPTACHPVDFKDTEGGVRRNHKLQLAAYALLVEDCYQRPAPDAYVYLTPTDEVVRVPVSAADREEVARALTEMRTMIRTETLPEATSLRARCTACEFQNYCADIW